MEIKVSIDCITYNHEKYIKKALDSFLMQKTEFKYEVLIHDDASTDNTPNIIREYEKKYPDIIKPIYQKENQFSKLKSKRMNHTYNFPRAKGKYIAMCEGDDYWLDPYKLKKQVDYMEKHLDCSMCFHAAEIYNVRKKEKEGYIKPYNKTQLLDEKKLFFGGGHVCPTASILYLKSLMDNPKSFFWESPVGDHAYALILSNQGKIGYINEVMSVRNLWVENSWNTVHSSEKGKEKMIVHYQKMIKMLENYNNDSYKRFEKDIYRIILILEIEKKNIVKKYGNFLKLNHSKFNKLSFKSKLEILFRCYFPVIKKIIKRIKNGK